MNLVANFAELGNLHKVLRAWDPPEGVRLTGAQANRDGNMIALSVYVNDEPSPLTTIKFGDRTLDNPKTLALVIIGSLNAHYGIHPAFPVEPMAS